MYWSPPPPDSDAQEPPEAQPTAALPEAPAFAPEVEEQINRLMVDKVARYRCEMLLRAGMTLAQARTLAVDSRVDLHFVLYGLIARGCDPSTAFDIALPHAR